MRACFRAQKEASGVCVGPLTSSTRQVASELRGSFWCKCWASGTWQVAVPSDQIQCLVVIKGTRVQEGRGGVEHKVSGIHVAHIL
jgi:hypothetical protein